MNDERLDADREDAESGASIVRIRGLALLEALERHLPGAREHAAATAAYAFATAAELGLGRERSELIREVARLHDVGMVYVAEGIAKRPPKSLDAGERRRLDSHHEAGYRLALGAGIPSTACEWMLHVGDRVDGGRGKGAEGEAIPLPSRIIRAACELDTAIRRAGRGGAAGSAMAGLQAGAGAALDPEVVEALARVVTRAADASRGEG